jgi:hypothetical protein
MNKIVNKHKILWLQSQILKQIHIQISTQAHFQISHIQNRLYRQIYFQIFYYIGNQLEKISKQ